MIKDIVVNLNVGAKANSASDYAISVAAALDAHLTGIIFLYGPIVPVSRAGYVPPELEVIERHNQAAVEASRESFTGRTRYWPPVTIPGGPSRAARSRPSASTRSDNSPSKPDQADRARGRGRSACGSRTCR